MTPEVLERATLRKVAWKLIPFLCALYIFNILDRANVGFARLSMQDDLEMGDAVFDLGIGIFYLGYLVFEVPSNLLMRRIGARRWIARIMISWGIISCLTMFVVGPKSFYLIRILLGVAEAGFFPGIILYLSYWFPDRERAKMTAYFMMAISFASMLGNPISGRIMQDLNDALGLQGWQWLFLLEGIPSILLGAVVLYKLTDRPSDAHWLEANEREWLVARMQQEESERKQTHGSDKLGALLDGRVWLLIAIYFTVAVTSNAGGAYFPKILKSHFTDSDTAQIGLLSALPHLCAAMGMVLFSVNSDRTGSRRGHVAAAALLGASGWALAAFAPSPVLALVGLCVAQMGMMSMLPTFWALPTGFLSGAAAAGGIALINSVANIGGALGPWTYGKSGPWAMAACLAVGAGLTMYVRRPEVGHVRRRFQFGLATMFAVVTLLAASLAFWTYHVNWIRQRHKALTQEICWPEGVDIDHLFDSAADEYIPAPGLLGMFGEHGYAKIWFTVPRENTKDLALEERVLNESEQAKFDEIKRLFPEAQVGESWP